MYFRHNIELLKEIYPGVSIKSLLLFLLSTPILFVCGHHYHTKAYKTIVLRGKLSMGMDFMVSMGTLAAYLYSLVGLFRGVFNGAGCSRDTDTDYFQTSASLIVVMLFGKFLESYAKGFTSAAVSSLSKHKAMVAKFVMGYNDVLDMCQTRKTSVITKRDEAGETSSNRPQNQSSNHVNGIDIDKNMSIEYLGRGDLLRLVEGDVVAADGILVSSISDFTLSLSLSDNTTGNHGGGGDNYEKIVEALSMQRSTLGTPDKNLISIEDKKRGNTICIGVDESMLSGESLPVKKTQGDRVYGGTLVVEGTAYLLISATGDDSTLGKIVATVQDAQASRPPVQETADVIARLFVPIVSAISGLTFLIWLFASYMEVVPEEYIQKDVGGPGCSASSTSASYFLFAFSRGLSVWVSACPCAFGLATPTAVLVATGVAASRGLLFRKGAALQYLSEVDSVALDKTGTITNGKMSVIDCHRVGSNDTMTLGIEELSWVDIYMMVLKVELRSSHPLAKGIVNYCRQLPKVAQALSNEFEYSKKRQKIEVIEQTFIPGNGIKAEMSYPSIATDSYRVLVGTYELLLSHGVEVTSECRMLADGFRHGGKVAIYVAVNDVFCILFGLADTIRPEAFKVIKELHRRGIEISMITGDEIVTARTIGLAVGISPDNIHAKASPDDKKNIICSKQEERNNQQRMIAFVGDGTNDSPALARADVGIVMSSGTDIAIEVGDVVLCKNNLYSLLMAIDISKVAMRRIKINYFWALGYNILLIPLAAGILYPRYHYALDPVYAGGAMALSSVSVVFSSLTLFFYKSPYTDIIGRNNAVQINNTVRDDDDDDDDGMCKCPVSISTEHAMKAQSSSIEDGSLLMTLMQNLKSMMSFLPGLDNNNRITTSSSSRLSVVYNQLSGDNNAENDNENENSLEMVENGKGIRMLSHSSQANGSSTVDIIDISGGCGCGKGNCMCGSSCRCGASTSTEVTSFPTTSRHRGSRRQK